MASPKIGMIDSGDFDKAVSMMRQFFKSKGLLRCIPKPVLVFLPHVRIQRLFLPMTMLVWFGPSLKLDRCG